jgi:hypothetical protein
MYRGKNESLRVIVWRILGRLKEEGLLKKKEVSHKHVQYSIKNRQKAKLRLSLKPKKLDRIFRQFWRGVLNRKLEDLISHLLLVHLEHLVDFEALMCKALAENDEESFRFFRRHGKNEMLQLWDVFADYLWERRKEAKRFYKTKLHELAETSVETGMARVRGRWVINIGSYLKHQQASANRELKRAESAVSILENALDTYKKHLERTKQKVSNPERMRAETLRLIKNIGKTLSYEELNQLRDV